MAGLVLLALAGGVTFISLNYANTGTAPPQQFTAGPVDRVAPAPTPVALTAADRNDARVVAELFIDTAVLRQRVDDSWAVTAPALRQGFTRAAWATGNIPVVPYDAGAVGSIKYRVDFSERGHVWLKVAIVPKPTSKADGQAFDMGLRQTVTAPHWVVDYWAPAGVSSPNPATRASAPVASAPKPGVASGWIFAPIAFFAAFIVGIPLVLASRGILRARRANRAYRASA